MTAVKGAVLTIRFLLELCMLAAFAYWGANTGETTAISILLAIAAPLAAATVWGVWLAPKSARRLGERQRIPLEVLLFGLAAVALVTSGAATAGVAFAVVAALDTLLVHALGE